MATTISTQHRAARNNGTLLLLDAGGAQSPGYAEFYAGARPADGEPPAGAMLIRTPFAHPAGVVQPDGSIVLSTGPEVLAVADGLATWARVFNGSDVRLFDCDASGPAGNGDLRLVMAGNTGADAQVYAGAVAQIATGNMG